MYAEAQTKTVFRRRSVGENLKEPAGARPIGYPLADGAPLCRRGRALAGAAAGAAGAPAGGEGAVGAPWRSGSAFAIITVCVIKQKACVCIIKLYSLHEAASMNDLETYLQIVETYLQIGGTSCRLRRPFPSIQLRHAADPA